MSKTEHARFQETLDLYADGALSAAEANSLDAHLATCDQCRREMAELESLHGLLRESRVPVRDGFSATVMAQVARSGPAVIRPVALAAGLTVLFVVLAAVLLAVAGGEVLGFGVASALADFVASTVLVGAGLLQASWRGIGMVIEEWLLSSLPNLIVSVLLIVALNVLAFRLVRSRRAVARSRHHGAER